MKLIVLIYLTVSTLLGSSDAALYQVTVLGNNVSKQAITAVARDKLLILDRWDSYAPGYSYYAPGEEVQTRRHLKESAEQKFLRDIDRALQIQQCPKNCSLPRNYMICLALGCPGSGGRRQLQAVDTLSDDTVRQIESDMNSALANYCGDAAGCELVVAISLLSK